MVQGVKNTDPLNGYVRGDPRFCRHFRTKGGLVGEEPVPTAAAMPRGLLQSDTDRRQRQLEDDISWYHNELKQASARVKEGEVEMRKETENEKVARRRSQEARARAHKLTQEISRLENEQERGDGKEQLRQLQQDTEEAAGQLEAAEASHARAKAALEMMLESKVSKKNPPWPSLP